MFIKPEVHQLLNQYEMRLTPDEIASLLDLVQARQIVAAVKLLRLQTSCGLKEAAEVVRTLEQIIPGET